MDIIATLTAALHSLEDQFDWAFANKQEEAWTPVLQGKHSIGFMKSTGKGMVHNFIGDICDAPWFTKEEAQRLAQSVTGRGAERVSIMSRTAAIEIILKCVPAQIEEMKFALKNVSINQDL